MRLEAGRLLAVRARASHLDARLPAGSLAAAASGGLQDSAPRAAVISLHARVEGVDPASWEDPSLMQIWGPRGADYVIPRDGHAAFTLGRMPRDPDAAARIHDITAAVLAACDGRARSSKEVHGALPELGHAVRAAAISGRLGIRWDARTIDVIPIDPPEADIEEARLDLARRFLRWFGPVPAERFAWWSGVSDEDAARTLRGLSDEIATIRFSGGDRIMLQGDDAAFREAEPPRGVRLLPHGDPAIKIDGAILVSDRTRRLEVFPVPRERPAFWPVSGAVMVDGRIAGSWARQQRRVTVNPWEDLPADARAGIEAEASAFPVAAAGPASVQWTR